MTKLYEIKLKSQTFYDQKGNFVYHVINLKFEMHNVIYLYLFYLYINIELVPSNNNINKFVLHS